ncbi:response regulator [bacterium]|nr:response regulator [bacterium]MBU1653193.1 response regulator [bacterium]MBU1882197.1 response regulator [bacterium]
MVASRILIVDDEEDICEMLTDFLSHNGYEVFLTTQGDRALKMVKEIRPHLMLLDIRLPELSGLEILQQVRLVDATIGVIMITGYNDIEIAQEALKAGASDFVTKPIELDYLLTSVKQKIEAMLS